MFLSFIFFHPLSSPLLSNSSENTLSPGNTLRPPPLPPSITGYCFLSTVCPNSPLPFYLLLYQFSPYLVTSWTCLRGRPPPPPSPSPSSLIVWQHRERRKKEEKENIIDKLDYYSSFKVHQTSVVSQSVGGLSLAGGGGDHCCWSRRSNNSSDEAASTAEEEAFSKVRR